MNSEFENMRKTFQKMKHQNEKIKKKKEVVNRPIRRTIRLGSNLRQIISELK